MRSYPHIGDVVVESWMNTITFEVEDGDVNENGFARAFGGDGGTVVRDNAGVASLRCRQ
jgi:hypothetical protein